jgi:uncharacterized membrane protein
VGKQKMSIKEYIINILVSLLLGFIVVAVVGYYFKQINSNRMIRYQTPKETKEQIQFLRDSFEMEYYKKQLESYPFEHSKIPIDDTTK